MDCQVDQIKTEPQESEDYLQQSCKETNQNFISNNVENENKFSPDQLHPSEQSNLEQFQNNGIQITDHINKCHPPPIAFCDVTNYDNYNMLDDEIIKTETKILDLNTQEQVLGTEENIHQPNQVIWKSNDVRKLKTYNCKTCEKSFLSHGYLKRHYKSILHKDTVKRSGLSDAPILPINTHLYTNDTHMHDTQMTLASPSNNSNLITAVCSELEPKHREKVKPFSCSLCGKRCATKSDLNSHKTVHGGDRPYKCNQCPKQFNKEINLEEHMYHHTGNKPFTCSVCKEEFSTRYMLKKHKFIHGEGKQHKCNQCPQQFTTKHHLEEHMYHHTGNKPFICSVCREGFITTYMLKKHKLTHSGKQHKCNQCPKQFYNKSTLTNHMFLHSGQKPFSCSVCGNAFSSEFKLNRHETIHSQGNPYKCDQCPKQFTKKCYLETHMYEHTGKKPFNCSICGEGFLKKYNFDQHKTIHRSENPIKAIDSQKNTPQNSTIQNIIYINTPEVTQLLAVYT